MGIAKGRFPAFAAAVRAEPGSAFRLSGEVAPFLAPLPVTLLPTSWEIKERLIGFGLDTIGSVARLPFDAIQGEFGIEGARVWRLANGQDNTPLMPRSHTAVVGVEASFETPTVSLPAIFLVLEGLLERSFGNSNLRGRSARVATLLGQALHASPWQRRFAFREPVNSPARAIVLFRRSLETLVLPGPLETLSLTLTGITGEVGRQESLFWDVRCQERLGEAISQLEARLGMRPPIYRIREVEPWSRIPERRMALVPYDS